MALAQFKVNKCTGASASTEAEATLGEFGFLNADLNNIDTSSHKVAVPLTAGDSPNYSMETWLRLECTTAPDNDTDNFKFWGPLSEPEASLLFCMAGTTATGTTPKSTVSSVATQEQQHPTNGYIGPGAGDFLAIGVVPGDNVIDAVAEKTEYLVLQLKVLIGATSGDMNPQVYSMQYDES